MSSAAEAVEFEFSDSSGSEYVPATDVDSSGSDKSLCHIRKKKFLTTLSRTNGTKADSKVDPSKSASHSTKVSEAHVLGVEQKSKKNCCYYCGKLVTKISRHLMNHNCEKEIINIHSVTDQKKKEHMLRELRLLGNYKFNLQCIDKGSGNLIVMRAPANKCQASSFLPCPYCFGFLYKRELVKHCKHCSFKPDHSKVDNPVEEAKLLLVARSGLQGNDDLNQLMLMKIREGKVKDKITKDPLILAFAASQLKRQRAAKGEFLAFIRQRLRILGRLLVECETQDRPLSLDDIIKPCNFDLFIHIVQTMTESEDKSKSLGLKIGHAIRKCCSLAKCLAIKAGNERRRSEVDDFIALLDGEWNDLVSSSLLRELYDKKLGKDTILPVTSDLMKLNRYMNSMLQKTYQDMETLPCEDNYFQLAKATLCKIIVFNKRRGGEVSRITLKDFTERPKWSSQKNEDISKSLTELEKKLAEKLDMIKVSGKRGRHVPILLTQDVVKAMDLLVRERRNVTVRENNKYFFATTGDKYLRGHEVLHTYVNNAGVSNPAAITSTNLRKYIATVSQVISLDKEELEWIADHLGHSIEVHRDFYRLQESTLEMCKVSKLLMAVENGSIHKLVGKKLSDIELEHCFPDDPDAQLQENRETYYCESVPNTSLVADLSEVEQDVCGETSQMQHKDTSLTEYHKERITEGKKNENEVPVRIKRKWDPTLRNQAFRYFKTSLVSCKVPGKTECANFLKTYSIEDRKWQDVKNLVYNEIKKKKTFS